MSSLAGKVAIITGASRGIGRAIALKLAGKGAAVVINYASNAPKAQEVVTTIENMGGKALAVQADISKLSEVEKIFTQTLNNFNKVDILINNAGIIVYKPITEVTEQEFDKLFAINVKGTYFACQQAAKHMVDGGRIINFSSTTTAMMLPTYSAYVGTKGAVEQITRVIAKELGSRGITVNTISPGPTDTELFHQDKTEEQINRLAQASALGGLGQVQDIAEVVAFLVSEKAKWITGQNIRVNGGVA